MDNQVIVNIIEVVLAVLGIGSIILQNRSSEQGASFFGGGGEVFKLRKGLDRFMFFATIIIVIALAVVIYIDIKFVN